MTSFFARVAVRLWAMWFTLWYGPAFRKLGHRAFLFRPFRVDGSTEIEIGDHSIMQRGGWLYCNGVDGLPCKLKVGSGCVFGYNNHIAAVRSVEIGDNVLTANNVYISDNIHGYEDITVPVMRQPVRFKKEVTIGSGSWIGENACIIGSNVGRNCVIGANAVVTSDIPDFCVAAGVPAVVIRQFDPDLGRWIDRSK